MIIEQGTNYNRQFAMVESADHITPLTGATVTVTLAKNTTAPAGAAGAVTELGTGLYYIALTIVDTNTLGDLGFTCTAASGDPTQFIDQVQTQIFPNLSLDSNGNAGVTSNIKKNTAHTGFMFVMTDSTTHAPRTGLTVSGFVALDGGSFSATGNAPVELANGWYTINLLAADVNGNNVALRFTATGADDRNIFLMTQP